VTNARFATTLRTPMLEWVVKTFTFLFDFDGCFYEQVDGVVI